MKNKRTKAIAYAYPASQIATENGYGKTIDCTWNTVETTQTGATIKTTFDARHDAEQFFHSSVAFKIVLSCGDTSISTK